MKMSLIALCALSIVGSHGALAQAQQQQSAPALVSIIGETFSGVRTWQGARNLVDGNRVERGTMERLYRDGHGRPRVEREIPTEVLANHPRMEPVQVMIND